MNDNEIIKALECCFGGIKADCENCPNSATCTEIDVVENIVNLINRQKAKIERLKDLCGDCSMLKGKIETISELEEQIEYWQRGYNDLIQELKTAKSEARKEFAERLKENTVTVKIGKQTCKVITVEGIDNLFLDFTKMVGGD